MLGTPTTSCLVSAAVCCLGVGIEFAVHALQHLAIDIWLRIAFDVVFASSLPLASGKRLQDDAGSFYASMCLPRDSWREVFGGPSELLQFVQELCNASYLKLQNSRVPAGRTEVRLAAD